MHNWLEICLVMEAQIILSASVYMGRESTDGEDVGAVDTHYCTIHTPMPCGINSCGIY